MLEDSDVGTRRMYDGRKMKKSETVTFDTRNNNYPSVESGESSAATNSSRKSDKKKKGFTKIFTREKSKPPERKLESPAESNATLQEDDWNSFVIYCILSTRNGIFQQEMVFVDRKWYFSSGNDIC